MTVFALHQKDLLYGIFLLSAVVVFGNGIHYLIFRVLRRREAGPGLKGLGLRQYLAKPA